MEHSLKEMPMVKEQEPTHLALAKEVSEKLIYEFGSKEQLEFITMVKKHIDNDYQCKLKESEAQLNSLRVNYDNFLGNPPKSES